MHTHSHTTHTTKFSEHNTTSIDTALNKSPTMQHQVHTITSIFQSLILTLVILIACLSAQAQAQTDGSEDHFSGLVHRVRRVEGTLLVTHWHFHVPTNPYVTHSLVCLLLLLLLLLSHLTGLDDYFECTVIEASPIMAPLNPGERPPEMDPSLTCSASLENANNGERITILLDGDTQSFFEGADLAAGTVSIRIPLHLVVNDTVTFDPQTTRDIILASNGQRKRNLRGAQDSLETSKLHLHRNLQTSVSTTGVMKVVIIRVSEDSSDATKNIASSPKQLMDDFFYDENNLAAVYKGCSNGKLTFVPAWGKDAVKTWDTVTKKRGTTGVVNIQPPNNICKMNWRDAGNYALSQMSNKSYWATHKVIILPDCVDFGGAAAWGETPGDTTWYKAQYASYPVTQVHEIGHNLGLRHSGRGNDTYGDGTGYMSAMVPWSDAGAKMCFNPAKMWYLGWYSSYHHSINPLNDPYIGKLVPIDDVAKKNNLLSVQDVVLKVQSNDDYVFIAYNRAKGANAQVVQEADTVVITRQQGQFSESLFEGSISSSDTTHTINDWGSSGKQLVIKLCDINTTFQSNSYDYAKIIVYVNGKTNIDCNGNSSSATANDAFSSSTANKCPLNDTWYDADGPYFNCAYYAIGNRCKTMGDGYARNGYTANTACCACMN